MLQINRKVFRNLTRRMRQTGQFRFFKTQLKTTDLSIEAAESTPQALYFIPRGLVLRFIVYS